MQQIQFPTSFTALDPILESGTHSNSEEPPVSTKAGTSILGAALRADFDALQNDFEQANAMAVDLQGQLAGKTNEFAQLKHLFEKTSQDLIHLQAGIADLREERHRLANEAMRATALEQILQVTVAERDKLKLEIETLRTTEANTLAESNKRELERTAEIAKLNADLQKAKVHARQPSGPSRGGHLPSPKMALVIQDLSESVNQLRELMEVPEDRSQPKSQQDQDFIAISFTG